MYAVVCWLLLFVTLIDGASVPWTPLEPAQGASRSNTMGSPNLELWDIFKEKFNKNYADENEDETRRLTFMENMEMVKQHNILYAEGKVTFTMGMNEFSDMKHEEFVAVMTGYIRNNFTRVSTDLYMNDLDVEGPKSVDWRGRGYVTPVKKQGQCGSCWAFAATGSLEGQHFRKSGRLVSLSEQNLMDCSGSYGNRGCNGGNADLAFMYIKDNGGIDTEASYPYEAKEGSCRFRRANVGATVRGYVEVPHGSEDKLLDAAAKIGPISIAIDAGHKSFQHYEQGVYVEPNCGSSPTQMNHGVLVVGYGTTADGQDYWIVKNSWGQSWGMKGYIWMARNRNNQCGVATFASYPLV